MVADPLPFQSHGGLALAEPDKVSGGGAALVKELIEGVLAVGARLECETLEGEIFVCCHFAAMLRRSPPRS